MNPENPAPVFSATPSTPEQRRGAAWRWSRIADVAAELGVSAQYIRNMIRDASHPLPFEKRAGDWHVKAGDVYEWICKHAKRRPPSLTPPRGYEEPKSVDVPPAAAQPPDSDIEDLDVEQILREVYGDSQASAEDKRTRIALAGELRRKIESDLKREKMLPIADVVKKYRAFGALLVEQFEASVDGLAADLLKTIREKMDGDIANPSAQTIVKSAACAHFNRTIYPALKQRVADECDGVGTLSFEGGV